MRQNLMKSLWENIGKVERHLCSNMFLKNIVKSYFSLFAEYFTAVAPATSQNKDLRQIASPYFWSAGFH